MMARDLDDAEFWLPSDFLADELESSPADSENEDDSAVAGAFLAGIARQMQLTSIGLPKASVMATSPQSTLCGLGGWSPEGPSQVSSPPSTPFPPQRDEALDLLHAAAGRVGRLGLSDDFLCPAYNPPAAAAQLRARELALLQQRMEITRRIQQQLQIARFYQLRRQQLMKQQEEQWTRQQSRAYAEKRAAVGPAAPPYLALGSGMRAVFLNGQRRESTGTGVFLPRRAGAPPEPKKKQVSSTVLLPARVIQALNLNVDDPRLHNETFVVRGSAGMNAQAAGSGAQDVRLPPEWTY